MFHTSTKGVPHTVFRGNAFVLRHTRRVSQGRVVLARHQSALYSLSLEKSIVFWKRCVCTTGSVYYTSSIVHKHYIHYDLWVNRFQKRVYFKGLCV